MKPVQNSPSSNLVASADPFNISAKGGWVLQGDSLTLSQQPELRTTSLAVADVFGKRHADVLRAVGDMECSKEFNERNFALVNYRDTKGESRPMVTMTRKGFEFLVLGFTGRKAAQFREAYIERFHAMEAALTKKTKEIEWLARAPEHMPYLNVSDSTGKKLVHRRIRNPDYQPLPDVMIRQTPQGEGSYRVD
jgi:Rha family phage regulatory protein